ncbi:MAG: hypothetical protein FWF77_07940 [Defluviitaleaceae bacterium]|nr:hypothetical protein [Defluviitaleaceae bacterium]
MSTGDMCRRRRILSKPRAVSQPKKTSRRVTLADSFLQVAKTAVWELRFLTFP